MPLVVFIVANPCLPRLVLGLFFSFGKTGGFIRHSEETLHLLSSEPARNKASGLPQANLLNFNLLTLARVVMKGFL